jgi:hypothetical protein
MPEGPPPYIYIVGEMHEQTPVKIGVTTKPHLERLAAYQGANWREMEYLLCRSVSIERMLVDEFLVHQALRPMWKKGEWYDVRDVAKQLGGWERLVDAAIAGEVPGGKRFELASVDGAHHLDLAAMKRVAHQRGSRASARTSTFEISCSCGDKYLHEGRLPKAIEQFAHTHLDITWVRPHYEPERVTQREKRNARNRGLTPT